MNSQELSQPSRLIVLIVELFTLGLICHFAFNQAYPPVGDKGFWFYAAALSLLLGSRLLSPFYSKPVDVISYSVAALVALALVNKWTVWTESERVVYSIAIVYCSAIVLLSFFTILTKDTQKESLQRLSNSVRIGLDLLGSPRAIFSVVIFFAIYVFHRDSTDEVFWVGAAWAITVALEPIDAVARLAKRIYQLWLSGAVAKVMGVAVAYQNPGIVLIRQQESGRVELGTQLLIKDPHAPPKIGLALDYVGRDEGVLLRALELETLSEENEITGALKVLPVNSTVRISQGQYQSTNAKVANILEESDSLVGIIAPDTTIEKIYFEVIRDDGLEEGRLVETYIGGRRVLYQVVGGITKEEVVHQKNTFGYARAQAQKIGVWDNAYGKFNLAKWLPKLNAPVFLVEESNPQFNLEAIGHFPKSDYPVGLRNIHALASHNTAILGILGVGKSMLAVELIERMITAGIKVICLDLTNQYAEELSPFFDAEYEGRCIQTIRDAGDKDRDSWAENPEDGGSLPSFSKAIFEDIQEFIDEDNPRRLKIYNPAQLFATKQLNEPRSYQAGGRWQRGAALSSLTPVEVTKIVTETTLQLLEGEMVDTARVCLVYEEAHSLIPEWNAVAAEGDKASTMGTARAILQGRKFGLGCLVVTQRTASVTKTILNQCNTIFAMRSFDETSKDFLSNYIGRDYASVLSSIPEREAVLFGKASACENPVLIRLNDRAQFLAAFRAEFPPPELPVVAEEVDADEVEEHEPLDFMG